MRTLITIVLLLVANQLLGQISVSRSVMASAGSELSNGTIEMSFTAGEVFTATLQNNEIHTLGFQQSDRWFAGINDLTDMSIELFPNPANEELTVTSNSNVPYDYQVRDLMGRVVLSGSSTPSILRLDVSGLEEGKYYFTLNKEDGNQITKGFITIH